MRCLSAKTLKRSLHGATSSSLSCRHRMRGHSSRTTRRTILEATTPNLYKGFPSQEDYFPRPRPGVPAVPNTPLPCPVPRGGRLSRGRLTRSPWRARSRLSAARRAGRPHPTPLGAPAAPHSAEAGGRASASRSEAGPDTHASPVPRPVAASGSSLRRGRPGRYGARSGPVVRGRSHGAGLWPRGPSAASVLHAGRGRRPIQATGCRGC